MAFLDHNARYNVFNKLQILAVLIAAISLRLYHLGYHDFWYDEIWTINYAQYPWENSNAPLYYILLHFWTRIFGVSEFIVRIPSLIFSFFSVILIYLTGKSFFNKKVGFYAAIFMAFSPFHLWYAQEARDYSMVLFFGTLASYLLLKLIREKKIRWWLLFILASIAGLYTNYFYIFLFAAQGLYILWVCLHDRKDRIKAFISFLIPLLFFALYLPRFLDKFHFVRQGFWIPVPDLKSLLITLENFVLGYKGSASLYIFADVLIIILLVYAFKAIASSRSQDLKQGFKYCLFLVIFPIACIFLFSKLFFSIYLDRGLIIFSPFFYMILSWGLYSVRRQVRNILFIILFSILFAGDFMYFNDYISPLLAHHTGTYIKKPIKPVVRFLEKNLKQGDVLAFTNGATMPSFRFYSREKSRPVYYFFDPEIPDSSWQRSVEKVKDAVSLHNIDNINFSKLWVISSDWARSGRLDENSQSVKDWLDRHLKLEFSEEFDGLWIFRYARFN